MPTGQSVATATWSRPPFLARYSAASARATSSVREGKVVHPGDACTVVFEHLSELHALLQVKHRFIDVAVTGCENAQNVVRLGQRSFIPRAAATY